MYLDRIMFSKQQLTAACLVGMGTLSLGVFAASVAGADAPQPAPLPAAVSGATPIEGAKEEPKPANEDAPPTTEASGEQPADSSPPAKSPESAGVSSPKPEETKPESTKSGDTASETSKSPEPMPPATAGPTPVPANAGDPKGPPAAPASTPSEPPKALSDNPASSLKMREKPTKAGGASTEASEKIQPTSSHGAKEELTGSTQETSRPGERDLLLGDTLAGWTTVEGKEECWKITDGVLQCVRPGGGWLRTNQEYSDFTLRFECRIAPGANTGIGFRFPSTGSPTMTGFEVQLLDDLSPKYEGLRPDQYNGSLYYFQSPDSPTPLKSGEWNDCEVSCKGGDVRVTINGTVALSTSLLRLVDSKWHPFSQRPTVGHIGLQSSSQLVEYRYVRIQEHGRKTEAGVTIVELTEGDGPEVSAGSTITVHYTGQLLDGKIFDSSLERGAPVTASLSRVIPGWRDGIAGMKVGGRRRLIIPASLAYGEKGVGEIIPPNSTLVFEVELRHFEQ